MADQPSTSGAGAFQFPAFYNYPPYFTLQPVKETRDKQVALWRELILAYCRHNKVYVISTQEEFPLFVNKSIDRRLSPDAIAAFLEDVVAQGSGEWLEGGAKGPKRQCLILWRRVQEWAAVIQNFVAMYGLTGGSVMLVEELRSGDDVRGSDLWGLHKEVLTRALKQLESQGKCKLFKGSTPEEEGVKFL